MAKVEPIKFVSVSSFVHSSFWNKLSEIKINVDKLTEAERTIWGFYSNVSSTWSTHVLEVDSTSFNTSFNGQNKNIPFQGKIVNKNTIEQFKDCDKSAIINREGRRFLDNLKNGAVLENPSLINFFFVLSFSDLKKYHFYYWFAFPVPHSLEITCESVAGISSVFTESQLQALTENYLALDVHQKPYFLVQKPDLHASALSSKLPEINDSNYDDVYFAFADYTFSQAFPKSQVKNYVLSLLYYCPCLGGKTVNFLLFTLDKKLSCAQSLVYKLNLPSIDPMSFYGSDGENLWAGWEKNEKNKFGPRLSNMRSVMDPEILFEESVDLNLKLMKWRLLPDINLEKIRQAKCLLLGAGTLGCSVARSLLGWGVRNITFVDNSTVSFSNPVRQSLYTYEDSVNSKPKSAAAAENLKKIFPGINSQGYQITIPMPGHSVSPSMLEAVTGSVEKLVALVQENDIIFLLTDSRESRWLPTLLGTFYDKIIINVALGFDTYLIMRYGGRRDEENCQTSAPPGFKAIPGHQLGCYFCNDVTAPGNSMKDRTLDQQCTVTRPGISAIAGALAVELTVSLLQHEEKMGAPAFYRQGPRADQDPIFDDAIENQSILGLLPHTIRGFISTFSHVLPATPRYNQCIACSSKVLDAYKERGFEFLCQAFNSSQYLEDLTGLTELHNENNYIDVLEMSDGDDW